MSRRVPLLAAAAAGCLVLAACTAPSPSPTPLPPAPTATSSVKTGPVQPVGEPRILAQGLAAPWSILRLGDSDSTLISERDSGTVRELTAAGELRDVGVVAGVVHQGEGGLLGLEVLRTSDRTWLYAYLTTASDNRIERMPLTGSPGGYALGSPQTVLDGLAKAGNHDGGRIKFGPDAMLYATVGDAGQPSRAQDPSSLNGKILRMTATGGVPADNPTRGSLVYSMGHRNPQGLAWDASGQLWAAEFGQNTWDELNRIEPGANYGWPVVEGIGGRSGFVDPLYQWPTSDASPSGLAFVDGTFFLAALRGERLWAISPATAAPPVAFLGGTFGRLRDAVPGPSGTLWLLTNNTDGRGTPHQGDDKLVELRLAPVSSG
ncbi:PQQ-dependent sugar dehydrogenase [Lacisediminihabitans sp.]|uniref:PQQ-dependent sugar dehydrogenase n=1 Tax=Lacisediminihabitans sp. TaxID=2787631 RepID=UPI00374D205D